MADELVHRDSWPHKKVQTEKPCSESTVRERERKSKGAARGKRGQNEQGVCDCLRFSLIPLKDIHNDVVIEQRPISPNMHHKSSKQKSMCSHNAEGMLGKRNTNTFMLARLRDAPGTGKKNKRQLGCTL